MPIYVQRKVLGKVSDVFSAEAIWRAPGLALFARHPLLRDLLERTPREQRGRAATRCFSHISLVLPQDELDDDRHLTRGARARELAQSLTALHQKDFGDLLHGDEVRYDVSGADTLAPGQVEVKFGHAVYLPAPGEKIQYNVSSSRDSAVWKNVCPVYPEQRLVLIGADDASASYPVPGWPFGPDAAMLLINDGPDAPIECQMRPKGAFECNYDAAAGYFIIRARGAPCDMQGTPQRLLLRITPCAGGAAARPTAPRPEARAPSVWQARSGAASASQHLPTRERTTAASAEPGLARGAGDDATYAPLARQRVSLVALALPRLSRYRSTGARALELGFDAGLDIAPDDASAVLRLGVDVDDQLYAISPAGREPISVPASFAPVDGRSLKLLPVASPMSERYCAMLLLPQTLDAPIATGARFVFGRSTPVLAALRVLDAARFLHGDVGHETASADRIGLSRNAFSVEAGADGVRIGRQAASQALFHLDQQLRLVASIEDAEQTYLLPPGHHLVAGHYILRFDA